MKYKVSTTTESEMELKTPCFVKFTDAIIYKIVDERKIITVKTFDFTTSIEIQDVGQCNPFGNKGWEFTNEEEYLQAERKALATIHQFTNVAELV